MHLSAFSNIPIRGRQYHAGYHERTRPQPQDDIVGVGDGRTPVDLEGALELQPLAAFRRRWSSPRRREVDPPPQ